MGTTFIGASGAQTFTNTHHTVELFYAGGAVALEPDGGVITGAGDLPDPQEPYNGFIEGFDGTEPVDTMLEAMADVIPVPGGFFVEVFADNSVDYSFSPTAVFIDLHLPTQQGGFAQGDTLNDIFEVSGSFFNDVIRGLSPSDFPPDTIPNIVNGHAEGHYTLTINNPGNNVLIGGGGDDVLEGRGGADVLIGGSPTGDFGFDLASYESSPAAVTVRLAGIGSDTQTAIASGGDAQGDVLSGIEGLVGSRFNDALTGNALDNVLAGGLGSDTLNGRGGNDTIDYSRDDFFDIGDTADKVDVHLGLNGAIGTAAEFKAVNLRGSVAFLQVSTDSLNNIENVTGTAGADLIFGNEQANVLNGREGNDTLDGGLGNDTLLGDIGIDSVTYASHNGLSGEFGTISLDGTAQYFVGGFMPTAVETDTLRGIENVTGSDLDETINGNGQDNIIDGGLGDDTINGAGGSDTVSYVSHDGTATLFAERDIISLGLDGAAGSYTRGSLVRDNFLFHFQTVESDVLRNIESVTGSNHAETINGNEQGNTLAGRGGNDIVNGGDGNDIYDFRGSGLGSDRYFDASGSDILLVNNFSDIVGTKHVGANGNDLEIDFQTGIGTVTIVNHFAGNQIETLMNSNGATMVLATGQVGGSAPGIITGSDGGDAMDGKEGDDILFGNKGADRMLGGSGNDRLDGGKGNDILDGGSGNDILAGGKGRDTFVFAPVYSDGLPAGDDAVTDFVHGQDRIDLTAFHTSAGELLGSHHGGEGPITIQSIGGNTVLAFDGGSITLEGVHHLQANDFIV